MNNVAWYHPNSPGAYKIPNQERLCEIVLKLGLIPADSRQCWYHYTNWEGLEGILRSGGLRAMHRDSMGDKQEFAYASNLLHKELLSFEFGTNYSKVVRNWAMYIDVNLKQLLSSRDIYTPESY